MSLRINRKTSDRNRFWKNLQRLKDLLERGQLEEEEMRDLVEILEQRLAWVEEDNRSYRTFFESLVSTLETNLQPPQIRDLIEQLGLREVLLRGSSQDSDTVH